MAAESERPTGVADLVERMRRGVVRALEVSEACLAAIERREAEVQAFEHLDPEYVRVQAKALDAHRRSGRPIGPLHGVPVGIKDIIDVAGMPTGNGCPLFAGNKPRRDAALVSALRAAGAVIVGKTVTTELAVYSPGKTRNPHALERTPGGSSSGSAAAVAGGMLPLAVGTQTNGSVIRPASFCGTIGFKPSFGSIPRRGILVQSPSLDQVGVFAQSVEDAAVLADVLFGYDPDDIATAPRPAPDLAACARAQPPVRPLLAFLRTPRWPLADEDMKEGFGEICSVLGSGLEEVEIEPAFEEIWELHRAIVFADLAVSFAPLNARGGDQLSRQLQGMLKEGREVRAVDYSRALRAQVSLGRGIGKLFERYDAILTPAVRGEAPLGLDATGDPVFCTPWTFLGLPAVSIPLLASRNGLPIGVQLVGRRDDDARLLRTASWLIQRLKED